MPLTKTLAACGWIVVLLFACAGEPSRTSMQGRIISPVPVCTKPEKITAIYKEFVYDLSGYDGVSGNSGFNLFDENDYVDPKVIGSYHPTTSPHPFIDPAKYFPKGRGSRIVIDLQVPYKLSEVYLFDMSRMTDSVWIYTGNMRNWKLKAALATKGDITQFGWRRFGIDDSSRYIMIRFNSWEAVITEAVFYGCPLAHAPARPPAQYTGPRLPARTIREFLGINSYQGIPLKWMKPFYTTRIYTNNQMVDFDTVNAFPNIKYNLAVHGWWNNGANDYVLFADSIVRFNKAKLWYCILEVPQWIQQKGYPQYSRPVTRIGMDTEDPLSYARHANMFWNLAAAFGSVKWDTNLIQASHQPRFSGKNLLQVYENGNEIDAYWIGDQYCSPMEYFATSSADYDGHEGKMGKYMGLRQADPNADLMMHGSCNLDTNRVRVLKFIAENLRNDKKFIWKGGVQYHYYSANGKGFPPERIGSATTGITPEEDSLRPKLARVREATYLIQPEVECILGEYGYDKSRASKIAAPIIPGYNQSQSQGIMLVRSINLVAFTGMDKYMIYWIKDDYEENFPNTFLTSGVIRMGKNNELLPNPAWFYISSVVNHMGNYIPDKIISEKNNVWIYRYRHSLEADSACYFIYAPSHNGTKYNKYALKLGRQINGNATEISLQEGSETGKTTSLAIRNGIIELNVTEVPKMIFLKER